LCSGCAENGLSDSSLLVSFSAISAGWVCPVELTCVQVHTSGAEAIRNDMEITACHATKPCIYKHILGWIYTGCPRRNVQYFGRVFLMLNYTDITQNTYIQSW